MVAFVVIILNTYILAIIILLMFILVEFILLMVSNLTMVGFAIEYLFIS
jgi:hypothetical protein